MVPMLPMVPMVLAAAEAAVPGHATGWRKEDPSCHMLPLFQCRIFPVLSFLGVLFNMIIICSFFLTFHKIFYVVLSRLAPCL